MRDALEGARCVLAYNASFDIRMLEQTARRYGLALPEDDEWRCLMLDYAEHREIPHPRHKGEYRWHTLRAAAAHEGVLGTGQSHRALEDARLALSLMQAVAAGNSL